MIEGPDFERVRGGLAQPDRGLYIAPIRHHSPACAWAVRQMIRAVRPKQVLVEAPADFCDLIPILLDPETRPPVAIAALVEGKDGARLAAYYPFCAHSPEYIALVEGRAVGATLSFIDLHAADKVMLDEREPGRPVALHDERHFDDSDYIAALTRRLRCRDGFELWDHLFETRLGSADWQGLLADVGCYCAGIRATTAEETIEASGDAAREAQMASALLQALEGGGPVVAVVGGFHAPALIEAAAKGASDAPLAGGTASRSYLIRYGFAALDALNGYAAGLPQPGYYDRLWQQALAAEGDPQWRTTALDLISEFAARMRAAGHGIPVPAQTELLRAAEALALLRARSGALRHDLIDAAGSVLVKGETGWREIWRERLLEFLRGNALGDVPASAGSPPLVEDARRRARAHRIDLSDGASRRRRLDIRRKRSHLGASRYLHAMALLGTGFAEMRSGPDYLHAIRTDLLFEEWSYAWSPRVEGRLIELAALADDVPTACLNLLARQRAEMQAEGLSRDLDLLAQLFLRGLLAGLGARLAPFLEGLASEIREHGDFDPVARVLRRLHFLMISKGPLAVPPELDLDAVRETAYLRLVYLCDDLPGTAEEAITRRLDALRMVMEVLRGPGAEALDHQLFDEAVERVADAAPPPEILGAVLALCVQSGRRRKEDLESALVGQFCGSVLRPEERIGVLRGVLATVPSLLWKAEGLLENVDRFLCSLSEDDFVTLLPHLRLAFTSLNPRETDRLTGLLARIHGEPAGAFMAQQSQLSDADLERGLAAERALRADLAADGLADWLSAGARP